MLAINSKAPPTSVIVRTFQRPYSNNRSLKLIRISLSEALSIIRLLELTEAREATQHSTKSQFLGLVNSRKC